MLEDGFIARECRVSLDINVVQARELYKVDHHILSLEVSEVRQPVSLAVDYFQDTVRAFGICTLYQGDGMACRCTVWGSSQLIPPSQPLGNPSVSSAPIGQRCATPARLSAASEACSPRSSQPSTCQPSAAVQQQQDGITRRRALQAPAAALLWAAAAQTLDAPSAAASLTGRDDTTSAAGSAYSPTAADYTVFQGKGGFTLRRPANAGWVTAFVSHCGCRLHATLLYTRTSSQCHHSSSVLPRRAGVDQAKRAAEMHTVRPKSICLALVHELPVERHMSRMPSAESGRS